ncbi:MAG TPA: cytochrome P450 [Bosea sp. (in: a-proteobacteria)]|jgi:cytochrome P450|uniref:cytochrome P450 n=1 Tax=Bosea sp. (in: a-proteobacteria) TaxID=1871050 RepID=UPI002DDD7E4B|nr:cytochrome P450 [Bosea sp. (in: a-proteobacteria)]HEV2556931.1 cytochrome P450 [Bosea sp. (in: a-proteobacteria)]
MGILRTVRPIFATGGFALATRYDDVKEVFANNAAFGVSYRENLDVITGGAPFFLGMGDTAQYRTQLQAMRQVVLASDLPRLGDEAEARARAIIDASGGEVEVVSLVRKVAFDLTGWYFGVPEPKRGRLDVWGSRLFEFQFTGSVADKDWLAEAEELATAFRDHIDAVIADRKKSGATADDVLQRCLASQAEGKAGYSDAEIRTAILCMVVGGPPQPPMVVPQGIEQLLLRDDWLAAAGEAARSSNDRRLHDILFEAMRFDPLAPGLKRVTLVDYRLARGTSRETAIPKGATVIAAFASAMMDGRRVPEPSRFDPDRQPHEYMHFGHGLHECFGRAINHATLHRMIKPLLEKAGLRRAEGRAGRLTKRGVFAERLVVRYG